MKQNELFIINKIRHKASQSVDKPELGALRRAWRLRLGIGDDAAALASLDPRQELLITTDLLVEGAHFHRRRHPARALGHKVLARGLSDIAAMGGAPLYALLSLCLPGWTGEKWLKQFLAGLFRLARQHGIALIGGDLSAGNRFVADIIVLGSAPRGRILERGRAKVGQILYVSGRLGGSALGLNRLLAGRFQPTDRAVRRHLYPTPRLALGRFLLEKLHAAAGMDLSDGLSIDLYRLTRESGVGADLLATAIPVFPGATLNQALHGGEDYELLFTLDPRRKPPAHFEGIPLTPIGTITAGRRLVLVGPDGRRKPLPIRGFQHKV